MATSRIPETVAAAVTALATDSALSTLLGGAKAWTHVPQGTDPPYVLVMGGDEVPWAPTLADVASPADDGDNGARQCEVLAQCVSTYRGSAEVDGIAARVLEVWTDAATWTLTALSGFQLAEFVRNGAHLPTDLNGVIWFQRTVTVRVTLT